MDETLLMKEISKTVDDVMQTRLKEIVGEEVSQEARKIVEQLRKEKALFGYDKTGLSDNQKTEFAKAMKAIAFATSTKANEALIEEQDNRGGYLVAPEYANAILRIAATVGIALAKCTRWPMKSDELAIPTYTGAFLEGAYLDVDTPGALQSIAFAQARLIAKKWQLAFAVGNDLLADAAPDVGNWLLALAGEALANMVDKQVFVGQGQPFVGIQNHAQVPTFSLSLGNSAFINYKVMDDSSDVIAQVEESMLDGAAFYFHRTVWAKLRTQKDASGNYLIQLAGLNLMTLNMDAMGGGPRPVGEILGFPVYTCRHLPGIGASAPTTKFGVFGNLKAVAFGQKDEMRLERFTSGNFSGEIALKDQQAMVMKNRHATTIALPQALVNIKTSA